MHILGRSTIWIDTVITGDIPCEYTIVHFLIVVCLPPLQRHPFIIRLTLHCRKSKRTEDRMIVREWKWQFPLPNSEPIAARESAVVGSYDRVESSSCVVASAMISRSTTRASSPCFGTGAFVVRAGGCRRTKAAILRSCLSHLCILSFHTPPRFKFAGDPSHSFLPISYGKQLGLVRYG